MVMPKRPGFPEPSCTPSDRSSPQEVISGEQVQARQVSLNRQIVRHKWRFSLPLNEAMLCRLNVLPDETMRCRFAIR